MREILILRHGLTEWNLVRRYHGALDSPLTDLGEAQARKGQLIARHIPDRAAHQI